MGVFKVRQKLVAKGSIVFGAGDVGIARVAADIFGPLAGDSFRIPTDGQLQFGSDVVFSRSAANVVDLASGDTLNLQAAGLRIPTVSAALGTSNMATASAGVFIAGFSGGSPQLGVVVNGSAFVLEGTVNGNVQWKNKT